MGTVWPPSSPNRPVGRFAPSPDGSMHAGNVFAALIAWLVAKSQGGRIVLRIEDLDRRALRRAYIDGVQRDLEALGLTWDEGVLPAQEAYRAAFDGLAARELVYPCFCTRADLHAASAPHPASSIPARAGSFPPQSAPHVRWSARPPSACRCP